MSFEDKLPFWLVEGGCVALAENMMADTDFLAKEFCSGIEGKAEYVGVLRCTKTGVQKHYLSIKAELEKTEQACNDVIGAYEELIRKAAEDCGNPAEAIRLAARSFVFYLSELILETPAPAVGLCQWQLRQFMKQLEQDPTHFIEKV
ncbi:unnamed protein product, partial [Mesorhabditis spiculigera]